VFVNGERKGSVTQKLDTSPDGSLRLGGRGSEKNTLHGLVDDVRVWNTARSQQDIKAHRTTRLSGDEAGLVGYWPLNEDSAKKVRNLADGQKGQLQGDPEWVRSSFTIGSVRTTLQV
jgi:hypothetical protein